MKSQSPCRHEMCLGQVPGTLQRKGYVYISTWDEKLPALYVLRYPEDIHCGSDKSLAKEDANQC